MSPSPSGLRLADELSQRVVAGERLAIVKAPPGSGKTYLLLAVATYAFERQKRVAVAAQTNAQADDICRRLAFGYPSTPVVRFASTKAPALDLGRNVDWITSGRDLPLTPTVVVGTVAKWGLADVPEAFDVLFVDEAWQMSWADFMPLGQVSERFVLIGDPGQIPPVVPIEVQRWETAPRPPHRAAPEIITADETIANFEATIDLCRRLPNDSVACVRPFYDFPFDALATPHERFVKVNGGAGATHDLDPALELLAERSIAAVTLPTDPDGPPFEVDPDVAGLAADLVTRLLERGAEVADGNDVRTLTPEDIGVTATHRVMNSAIETRLGRLRGSVRVDTPERWQGLERKIMVAVHPLSGIAAPSGFDLSTGRLCVMASRHRAGLILVARDHVRATLDRYIPAADQSVGRPDVVGRGHFDHLTFWERLSVEGQMLPLTA